MQEENEQLYARLDRLGSRCIGNAIRQAQLEEEVDSLTALLLQARRTLVGVEREYNGIPVVLDDKKEDEKKDMEE